MAVPSRKKKKVYNIDKEGGREKNISITLLRSANEVTGFSLKK